MADDLPTETCPHCNERLIADPDIGYRRARIIHLVSHALRAAIRLTLDDLPDRSFWEVASACEEDTWDDAAVVSHDVILDVIDSIGPMSEKQQEKLEGRAIGWLKERYRV